MIFIMGKNKINKLNNNLVSLKQREKVLFDTYKQNRTYKEKRFSETLLNKIKFENAEKKFKDLGFNFLLITEKDIPVLANSNWQKVLYEDFFQLVISKKVTLTEKCLLKLKTAIEKRKSSEKLKLLETLL